MDREAVLDALRRVVDPDTGRDIVSNGMVQGLTVRGDAVGFALEVPPERGPRAEPLRQAAEDAARKVSGVSRATVVLTAHGGAPSPAPGKPPPSLGPSRRAEPGDKPLRPVAPPPNDGVVPGVARVLAVGSGKGGVGKSTVACNLALALAAGGARVGLLDADVYGPSQPRMLGLKGRPTSDGETIVPLEAFGVKTMSMGFLVDEEQSVVWRGPMLMRALTQMLHQVAWAPLDWLVVDLPPGTGDVQLTLTQKARVTGAVIVSTPQDIALLDARKAMDMFRKTSTPILGIVENMSTFCCPKCGEETAIFGHGGARREAERLSLPFLGEIPLDLAIRTGSDEGAPVVAAAPDSPQALRFREIARLIAAAPEAAGETGRA